MSTGSMQVENKNSFTEQENTFSADSSDYLTIVSWSDSQAIK